MTVIVFDFDGVISDSSREAFMTAAHTWIRLRPDSWLVERFPSFPADGLPRHEDLDGNLLFRGFMELMPLGNRAEDFGVALAALDLGTPPRDQQEYDLFRASLGRDWLAAFHRRFYAERETLRNRDPAGWRSLQRPYRKVVAALRRNAARVKLAIATAKDLESVRILLTEYDLENLFPPRCIADKQAGPSKCAHLHLLRQRLGVEFASMTFVDDKVNHLDDVASLGVTGVLAAWGYNGERERVQAGERGYRVLHLENLESALFPARPGKSVSQS